MDHEAAAGDALPQDAATEPPPLSWTAGPELTIAQAGEVHAQWLQLLEERPSRLLLSLEAVEEFDSAGVQLLLSLKGSAARWGCESSIVSCSPAVRRALADYRLEAVLGLQSDPDGRGPNSSEE